MRSNSKNNRRTRSFKRRHFLLMLIASCAFADTSALAQVPTGADVVAGQAAISQAGNALNINASTNHAIVNWDAFNIGAGHVANFNLPDANSAILNRVTSADMPSIIAGALNSNGHVYLVNPSGIMVTSSGMVNTNGFTASTFDIANQDFMAGGALRFSDNGSTASVVNNGTITTGSGGAHLIANDIANNGTITSQGGNITLSGGGSVMLSNGVTYVQPTMDTLASGISPTAGLIQNTGTIRATGAATSGGEVYLVNPNGKILHDGTIVAGTVPVPSAHAPVHTANCTGTVPATLGGHVQLEAREITLTQNSSIDATGTHGGGTVLVGGGWQGSGDMTQATTVTMEAGATIDASATVQGDGGKIVLWTDIHNMSSVTQAFGTLLARAGELLGNGGQIETSGHVIEVDDAVVNAGATNGTGGHWLIDPYNWIIGTTNASRIASALNSGTSVTIDTQSAAGPNSTANNDGTIDSNNAVLGDIQVNSAITKTSGSDATLRLNAANSIVVNAAISSNSGALSVILDADNDAGVGDGGGIVILGNDISTNGGSLRFGTDRTANIGGVSTKVGGDVYVTTGSTLSTDGGFVEISGETILGSTGGLTVNSGGGNVTFDGVLNSGNTYQFITGAAGTGSWSQARVAAQNGTAGGAAIGDSYLVAITSRLENSIASSVTLNNGAYRGAWIGVYRPNAASSYNWVYAGGPESGQTYFVQSGGGGGTALADRYNNFGPGEPNGALSSGGESAGQFFGSQGLWNDLGDGTTYSSNMSSQYNVMGYVRETNLAPAPLTINAGSGNVTFNAGIGASKAISTLNVTSGGIMLNGGVINTQGMQTYNGPVILGAHTNLSTIQSNIVFGSTVNSSNPASPWNLNATITPGNTYYWVDWTNWNNATKTATGTITAGSDVITVTYFNPQGIYNAQTNGGTNYWTGYSGGAFAGASPYVSSSVANGPSTSDIIQLQFAGSQTLTFSESVENLAFSIVSMNGNGYGFDQNFTIEGNSGVNGAGPGYFGAGNFVKSVVGNTFQLNDGGVNGASVNGYSEPHGTVRFGNAFSSLTWNSLSNELWNGFTVGVSGTSSTAGSVQFNGAIGGSAAVGAININGAMQTTANIVDAASLNVSGLSNLGGNINTSGSQSFGSAITMGTDLALTTTNNGSVHAVGTIDGNHRLTMQTGPAGNVTLGGSVGGKTALSGLDITTTALQSGAVALAANGNLNVDVSGASSIGGTLAGPSVSLTKAGSGTLTLAGTNTYTGATSVSEGSLSIASDANLGSAPASATSGHLSLDGGTLIVTSNMTLDSNRGIALGSNHGTISVASGRTFNFGGIIEGTGNLTKNNTGTLNLSGSNTYTGNTSIVGGTLQANNASALGNQSFVTLGNTADAQLNLLSNLTIGSLSGGSTSGGNIALGSRVLTTGGDGKSTTFAGVISGTGSLFKAGAGNFALLGNQTYTGATTINAGSLILRNDAPTASSSSFQGPGTLTIESAANSFSSAFNTSGFNLSTVTPLGGLTVGKATNTADITIGSNQIVNGQVNLYGGNITINAGLTSLGTNTVNIEATGIVTDGASGFISTDKLLVKSGGTTTLDSTSNAINTFAFDGGALHLLESNGFTVGSVGSTNGITASGVIDVATLAGNLTIDQNIVTTNATATAILLNSGKSTAAGTATGGNLVLDGSPSIIVGSGGRATLMTGSIADSSGLGDLIGTGSGHFRYNSDEVGTNYSLALGNGLYGIYRQQPTVTGIAIDNQTQTYGDTATLTGTLSGNVNGDTLTQIFNGTTIGGPKSTSNHATVGTHTLSTGAEQLGYSVGTINAGTLTVTAKSITTPLVVDNKTYDSNTNATFTATANGLVTGDLLSIGGTSTFTDKNVGTGKTVNYVDLNLTGTDAANYSLSSTSGTSTADITARSVTVSGIAGVERVYDGTTAITLNGSGAVFTGMVSGDSLSVTSATGTLADKDAGTSKSVAIASTNYGGTDVGNYTFVDQTSTTANITPATLYIAANNDSKFVTKSDIVGYAGASYQGFVGSDGFSDLSGSLAISRSGSDEAAGTYSNVLTASGLTSTNYAIQFLTGDYTIVAAEQFLIRFGHSNSIYGDALTFSFLTAEYMDAAYNVASLTPTVTGNNYAFNDGVGGTATFTVGLDGATLSSSGNANVGTYGLATNGLIASGGNFNNNLNLFGSHTIDRANLAVNAGGVNKSYDGTNQMSNLSFSLNGLVTGDTVSASGQGNYASINAGAGLAYNVSNIQLYGTDSNNYALPGGTSLTGTDGIITPKNVTITGPSVTKVYDGNTGIAATALQLQDWTTQLGVIGDAVIAMTLTYNDKNVGTGKTITPSAISITDGNNGDNYNIMFANDSTSSITRLGIVTWIGGTTGDWNDPANWTGGAIPDLANVAGVIIPLGVTPTFGTNVNGPVQLDSFTGGSLKQDGGTLDINGNFTADTFTQNGGALHSGTFIAKDFNQNAGTLGVDETLTVTNTFHQAPTGTIEVGGTIDITHTTGILDIENVTGHGKVKLNSTPGGVNLVNLDAHGDLDITTDGDVTQGNTGTVTSRGETTISTPGDITLEGPNNDFQGPVSVIGRNVSLNDKTGGITLRDVTTTGTFNVTAGHGGDIEQTDDSDIHVGTTTTLETTGDVKLDGKNNHFGGPVNINANNVEIAQRSGDLELGDVTTMGGLGATATTGEIKQTSTGTVDVGGDARVKAKQGVDLSNPSNNFRGKVIVDARKYQVYSLSPLTLVRTGAALADEGIAIQAKTVNDSLVRPGSSGNSTAGTSQVSSSWFSRFQNFIVGLFRSMSNGTSATGLVAADVSVETDQVFIKSQSKTGDAEIHWD